MIIMRKSLTSIAAIFFACVFLNSAHAEVLTNDTVIQLTRAGLGAETVVAKINSSANTFDLSTDQLIKLKQAKVSDPVIAAMLGAASGAGVNAAAAGSSDSPDPLAPHASGIYLLHDWAQPQKMQRMDATSTTQTKDTGRLLSAITYGIAKVRIITVLPNPTARVRVKSSAPVFYFYFDESGSKLSSGGSNGGLFGLGQNSQPVTSTNEVTMIRFNVKKGNREVVLAQGNIAGTQSGVMDKARVAFSYEDVAPGVFKVTPSATLEPGEYGNLYSASGAGNMTQMYTGGSSVKIFDFGVE
jgi:hypothetical protein